MRIESWSWIGAGSPPRGSTGRIWLRSSGSSGSEVCGRPSGRRRVRDHRREIGLRGELVADISLAGELTDAGALLDESDFEPQQDARLHRLAEFGAVDRHEIDEL